MIMINLNAIKLVAICAVFLTVIGTFPSQIMAQVTQEASQPAKISWKDQLTDTQKRIEALRSEQPVSQQNLSSTRSAIINRYALEKAQCWIDLSNHESLRNNPSEIPLQALLKAQNITRFLENKQVLVAQNLDSELLSSATGANLVPRMRPDLWGQLETLKNPQQLACSAQAVACAEVMLVQAAHAHEQMDWRYARPYFGMAEDLLRTARQQALNCKPSP